MAPLPTRIGFSTPRAWNPISAFIRKVTGARASHTWVLYYDAEFQQDMVMEAHSTEFRLVTYRTFRRRNRIVEVYEPVHDIDAGLPAAAAWLGEPYDTLGLFGMAWVMLGRTLERKLKNPFRSRRSLFCSEAVVRTLQAACYPDADEIDPESIDPWRLRTLLAEHGSVLRERDDEVVGETPPALPASRRRQAA